MDGVPILDIDPVQRAQIADTTLLEDDQAFALHHNNLAIDDLFAEDIAGAYRHSLRSLQLSPENDYLWVNLGAIYRRAGQDNAAERSYRMALQLNPQSPSAMNNLVVLFSTTGDLQQAAVWEQQVVNYRRKNPYYYVYLGAEQEREGNYVAALDNYLEAISRKDDDAEFYYRAAKIYLTLEQRQESVRFMELAIKYAQLVGERETYEAFLDTLGNPALASAG